MASDLHSLTIIPARDWLVRAEAHRRELSPWTDAFRSRRACRDTHPVHDFLFTYYSHRPSHLELWHPGAGSALELDDLDAATPYLRSSKYRINGDQALYADVEGMTPKECNRIRWIRSLLGAVDQRPPQFGCSGLHEWAMVYNQSRNELRHSSTPLRLEPEEIDRVVDSSVLACSHYDAFRFFTDSAVPRNTLSPGKDRLGEMEQSGCLHTNMDLYKWAYKMSPWVRSDLLRETFFLALKARELDMRASPYDLSGLGYSPIPMETDAGRQEYRAIQQELSTEATPLRRKLNALGRRHP